MRPEPAPWDAAQGGAVSTEVRKPTYVPSAVLAADFRCGREVGALAVLALRGDVLAAQSALSDSGVAEHEALSLAVRLEQAASRDPSVAAPACDVAFAAWRRAGRPPLACAAVLRLAALAGRVEPAKRVIAVTRASGLALTDPLRPAALPPLRRPPGRPQSGRHSGPFGRAQRRERAASAAGQRRSSILAEPLRVRRRGAAFDKFLSCRVTLCRPSQTRDPGWELHRAAPVVLRVARGGAAEAAGICAGMRVLAVHGKPVDSSLEVAAATAAAPRSFELAVDVPPRVWRRRVAVAEAECAGRVGLAEQQGRQLIELEQASVRVRNSLHIVLSKAADQRERRLLRVLVARCHGSEEPLLRRHLAFLCAVQGQLTWLPLALHRRDAVRLAERRQRKVVASDEGCAREPIEDAHTAGAADIRGRELLGAHRRQRREAEEEEAGERAAVARESQHSMRKDALELLPLSELWVRVLTERAHVAGQLVMKSGVLANRIAAVANAALLRMLSRAEKWARLTILERQNRAAVRHSYEGGLLVAGWLAHDPLRLDGDEQWERQSLAGQYTAAVRVLVHADEQGRRAMFVRAERHARLLAEEYRKRKGICLCETEGAAELLRVAVQGEVALMLSALGAEAPEAVDHAEDEQRQRIAVEQEQASELLQLAFASDDAGSWLSPRTSFILRGAPEERSQWRHATWAGLASALAT